MAKEEERKNALAAGVVVLLYKHSMEYYIKKQGNQNMELILYKSSGIYENSKTKTTLKNLEVQYKNKNKKRTLKSSNK